MDIDKDAENDFNLNNLVELLAVQEVKSETEHIKQEATEDDGRRQRQERVKQNVAAQENLREFNVIKYDQMYKTKQMQRIALEEKRRKELCSFQSKPAPNFQAIHAANGQKRNKEQIPFTVPATPKVVQRHREAVERIRKKVCIGGHRLSFHILPLLGLNWFFLIRFWFAASGDNNGPNGKTI